MGAGTATCVVWGRNAKPILKGVLAHILLTVSAKTKDASAQVELGAGMAADSNGAELDTTTQGSTVTIVQPPGLNGLTCNPLYVTPPANSTCTVYLTAPAWSGGAIISLGVSPEDATAPSQVTIAEGNSYGTFTVAPGVVTVPTPVTLAASYLGTKETFGLTINPAGPNLKDISVNPSVMVAGRSGSGTITLSAPAGAGGLKVGLSSSRPGVAKVPSKITIPEGATAANFTVAAGLVTKAACIVLTASSAGQSQKQMLIVEPAGVHSGASACFETTDTTTQGDWKSTYGGFGYAIVADSNAGTAKFIPSDQSQYIWDPSTSDPRALRKASGSDGIAAMWYADSKFSVVVDFPSRAVRRVALYCLDWNHLDRTETIEVLDAKTNTVLDKRKFSNFEDGVYGVWYVSGNVKFQITRNAGKNAVISGIFLN
jgi:hypothetical protein